MIAGTRDIALAVWPLPGGASGLVGATAVISCEGSSREIRRGISGALEAARREFGEDSRAAEILSLIEYRPAAEQLLILDVDHLVFKVSDDAQPEARDAIANLLGEEGPRVRLATPDQNYVVLAFGGGAEHLNAVVNTMRGDGDSLLQRQGVPRMMSASEDHASGRALIAVDAYLNWYAELLRSLGESPTLIEPEPADVPVAVTARALKDGVARIEIDVPIELLTTLKTAWDRRGPGTAESETPEPAGATED